MCRVRVPRPTHKCAVEADAGAPTAAAQSAPAKPASQSKAPVARSPLQPPHPRRRKIRPAPAVDVAQAASYFGGKTRVTVGYAPGGGYDTYARIVAVHMGRHVLTRRKSSLPTCPALAP